MEAIASRLEAIVIRNKDATRGTPGLTTRSKRTLLANGLHIAKKQIEYSNDTGSLQTV